MRVLKSLVENTLIAGVIALFATGLKLVVPFLEGAPLEIRLGAVRLGPQSSWFLLTLFLVGAITGAVRSGPNIIALRLGRVAPQFRFFGEVQTYGSNGYAKYSYSDDGGWHIQITLQNFESNASSRAYATAADCGIILCKRPPWPIPHLSLSDKSTLSFQIKTAVVADKIGISLKNTAGHEIKHCLAELTEPLATDVWKPLTIKLEKFSRATRATSGVALLECLTFFTNSNLSGSEVVSFSVKAIALS